LASKKKAAKKTTSKRAVTKSTGAPKPPGPGKKQIAVHPRLADAIHSLRRFSPAEMTEVKALAGQPGTGAASTGCFISDSGGQQHCINLPPDVCTNKGGISVPTRCPKA
jgi:hypothetical protein